MRWFASSSNKRRSEPRATQEVGARLLDAAMLAALRGMNLRGRQALGAMSGAHPGGMPGAGEDFFQHRAYVRGEDLRGIDFRASARAGHLLVKERHRPVRRAVVLMLDGSASMGFPRTGLSKLGMARRVGAAIAYLALQAGDAVSLLLLTGQGVERVGKRVSQGRAAASAEGLLGGRLDTSEAQREGVVPGLVSVEKSSLAGAHVVLLSDLYGDEAQLISALRGIRMAAAELTVFHTLAAEDLELPKAPVVRDAETGEERGIDAAERSEMVSRVESWRERVRAQMLGAKIEFVELDARVHPAMAMRRWLASR